MKEWIDCSKYNIFNLHKKNDKFNSNKQLAILMKLIKWVEIYEKKDLEVLKYTEEKKLVENNKLTNKWKCFVLNVEEMKYWQRFYLLALFIIFWLPVILVNFWKYIPIDWKYWSYFYFFMITFWMIFLMSRNRINREKYLKNFTNKYLN